LQQNMGKEGLCVNLKDRRGLELIHKLVKTADVFVENYRPGSLDRMGLGFAQLRAINPRLVYCSVSGFGLDGPYRDRGGFDLIAQAMSGIMSFTGEPGGERPTAAGVPLCDLNAGMFAAVAVLAALQSRERTGEGQHVESSLLESALAYTVWETGLYLTTGEVAKPMGTRHRLTAPYQAMKTADGFMVVGVNNQRLWLRFLEALGAPELNDDERFGRPNRRVRHRDELQEKIGAILTRDTTANWMAKLEAVGVPAGPLNDIAQAWDDPQVKARGLMAEADGRRFVRTPIKMSGTPVTVAHGPAEVGQHTRQVLGEAGYSESEIDALLASGAAASERKEATA
jgi:crotonobetainyl-CoA:carnitine CoA-transferase CaiB-like acyl-CoA transferase